MNRSLKNQHTISSFSSLLLFFVFILFLLPVLILAAGAYQSSVEGKHLCDNLYTASTYLTTKFRQYDGGGCTISESSFGEGAALCFAKDVNGKPYDTYLYLWGSDLKELFTLSGSAPDPSMGTTIAHLSDFTIEKPADGMFVFTLTDENGDTSSLLLHAGTVPGEVPS